MIMMMIIIIIRIIIVQSIQVHQRGHMKWVEC
jgi:hypothetical protein